MPVIAIQIRGLRDVSLQLRRLQRWKVGLHRPLGELLKRQHERRVLDEKTDPSGRPWEALKESTILKKTAKGNANPSDILVDTRAMAGNFRISTSGDLIRLRNPSRCTIYHQEGTRYMVARPFMGLSNPNIAAIRRLVVAHIQRVMSNNLGTLSGG